MPTVPGGALAHSNRVAVEDVSGNDASCPPALPSSAADEAAIAWIVARRATGSAVRLERLIAESTSTRLKLSAMTKDGLFWSISVGS